MDRIELNHEIPVILIDNYYNDDELKLIWQELEFLNYSHKLLPPSSTGAANDNDTTLLKNNSGLFLDTIWNNQRQLSNILSVNRKLFENDMEILRQSPSWFYRTLVCTEDNSLLSYYEDGDYYQEHRDNAAVTVLSWFFKEPKCFSGGDLRLNLLGEIHEITVKNNRTLIFPGAIPHSVTPVSMSEENKNQGLGRYCLTQFLAYSKD